MPGLVKTPMPELAHGSLKFDLDSAACVVLVFGYFLRANTAL